MTAEQILETALETIRLEAEAIRQLEHSISPGFAEVIQRIHQSTGRLVVSGIGKSAIIAQKIVATLNSTGTPALFLHAADAIHGDLGMMQENDIALLISKSGESPEIKVLVPLLKSYGHILMAICGKTDSFLAREADYFIDSTVSQEACPNNLAPTSSTTAQLVLGDAIAVCLLTLKGFTPADFARFHPGGALGKQLYLKALDLCNYHERPQVSKHSTIQEVILEITGKRLGATAVLENERIVGMITDGDIRRMLEQHTEWIHLKASDIMNKNPKTVSADTLAVVALEQLRKHAITQLIVLDGEQYCGMLHLHDLIREGLV